AAAPVVPAPAVAAAVHVDATEPPSRTGAWIATATGVALLGGALGFDLWGDSTYNQAQQQGSVALWNSANTKRYVAEGMLVGGIAASGIAAYLWLRGGHETATVVAPVVSPGGAGVQLGGRW